MTDQRSAEERLRAAGWIEDPRWPGYWALPSATLVDIWQSTALIALDAMGAAEARGRAQGQREGREAERADVVAYLENLQARDRKVRREGCDSEGPICSESMLVAYLAGRSFLTADLREGEHVGAAERGEDAG